MRHVLPPGAHAQDSGGTRPRTPCDRAGCAIAPLDGTRPAARCCFRCGSGSSGRDGRLMGKGASAAVSTQPLRARPSGSSHVSTALVERVPLGLTRGNGAVRLPSVSSFGPQLAPNGPPFPTPTQPTQHDSLRGRRVIGGDVTPVPVQRSTRPDVADRRRRLPPRRTRTSSRSRPRRTSAQAPRAPVRAQDEPRAHRSKPCRRAEGSSGAIPVERYLDPNTRSNRPVSPAVWNLTSFPSR